MLSQAVFLVGGLGSRLGPLTTSTPKPLLSVGGRPFLDYLIEQAARHGLWRILLLCGYRGEAFVERYRNASPGGVQITVVVEPEPAGTGGALRHAAGLLDERFVLVNGDTFFDINWLDLLTVPGGDACVASLALRSEPSKGARYGGVELRGESVTGFGGPNAGPVNAGLYVVDRSILGWIDTVPGSIEHEVFPRLAAAGLLKGRIYDRYFLDIGVPTDFVKAQTEIPAVCRRPAIFVSHGWATGSHAPGPPGDSLAWVERVRDAIKLFNDLGFLLVLLRSYESEESCACREVDEMLRSALQPFGAHFDAVTCEVWSERDAPWQFDPRKSILISRDPMELRAAEAKGIAGELLSGDSLTAFARTFAGCLRGPPSP